MLYRYLTFKIGVLGICAWIIDHFNLDVHHAGFPLNPRD